MEWKKEVARGGVEGGVSQRWSGRRSWPEVEWKEELAGGGVGERTLYSRTVSCACTTCSYPVQGVPTPETAYVLLLTYPINEFRKLPYYSINAWFLGLSTLFVVVSQFNLVSVWIMTIVCFEDMESVYKPKLCSQWAPPFKNHTCLFLFPKLLKVFTEEGVEERFIYFYRYWV